MTHSSHPNGPAQKPGLCLSWAAFVILVVGSVLLSTTACTYGTAAQEGNGAVGSDNTTCVGSLFDVSMSAAAEPTKNRYLRDFAKIVAGVQAGDMVFADTITENPSATMTFPVRVPLPAYDAWQTNPMLHRQELEAAKQSLIDQTTALVRRTPATQKTAILDAIYVTRKAFDNQDCRKAARRVLVVFSDMQEDSERGNFLLDALTPSRIVLLLKREQRESHLPDMRNTDVWIAGATPDRNLGPSKIRSIEGFWTAYGDQHMDVVQRYRSAHDYHITRSPDLPNQIAAPSATRPTEPCTEISWIQMMWYLMSIPRARIADTRPSCRSCSTNCSKLTA